MKAVLSMGWQLICFRVGPSGLPYQPRLILPLLLANLALSLLVQQIGGGSMERPVLQISAIGLAAEGAWLWWLVRSRDLGNRWVQGYTGLVLVDTLITLLAAPASLLLLAGDGLLGLLFVLQLVMTLWSLSARGFVYQETLDIPRWRGVLLALVPMFAVIILTIMLFPELLPAQPATQGK